MPAEPGSARDDIRRQMVTLLPRLMAFARSLSGSREAAEDLAQTTCEKALRNIASWAPGTRLDAWMFRIMRNQWIDEKRRPRLVEPVADPAIAETVGEDGRRATEARSTLHAVGMAIDALPEEQRSVLILTCVEDMSYRDTAEILDIPIGTVMSRLARARRAIALSIGENGGATSAGRPQEHP